jgi:phage tail P2-like protein
MSSIRTDDLLKTLPHVLKMDNNFCSYAGIFAKQLGKVISDVDSATIYAHIDMLPEAVLDILAYDFKVDWYNYNYSIETKRELIKTSLAVHKHMGTKGAMISAVSTMYPYALVEEWFEYGGEPYYFRVILDEISQNTQILYDELLRSIEIYKACRAHLECVAMRTRCNIEISCSAGHVVYSSRLCGTYPARATQGIHQTDGVKVAADTGGAVGYSAKLCGTTLGLPF